MDMVKLNGHIFSLEMIDELLEKYNIWNKLNIIIKKEFDNKPIHTKKFLKNQNKIL